MGGYLFKETTHLKNVVSMDLVERNQDFAYEYFMKNNVDIIYVIKNEKLEAVVSPGDVHKFYIGEGEYEVPINKKFSFLSEVDYEKAQKIFERIPTIHEIPVVSEGKLEGIVTDNQCKTEREWNTIRDDLKKCKMSKVHTEWLCADLLKWKKCFPNVKLLIYYIPSDKYLMPGALEVYKRRLYGQYDKQSEAEKREGFASLEYDKVHMTHKNGIYKFVDMDTDTCKISKGNRKVPNANAEAKHKVLVFGPCTMFGAYVDDVSTVEYFLQEKINNTGKSYQVCNCSMMGEEYSHSRIFTEDISTYDVVILTLRERDFPYCYFDTQICKNFRSDLSLVYDKLRNAETLFLDQPAHCNDVVNKKIADVFFEDIKNSLMSEVVTGNRRAMQEYYIDFDIKDYFIDFAKQWKGDNLALQDIVGSIVMNCNPFTLGHRFLIEKALESVDYLYIFVVEENESFFSFEDRIQMVKDGVRDLQRVRVIPSGKYIISKDTFAQYFEKESVTEIESMDYDVRIFGEVVAPEFRISYRFVGEEPFDIVTHKYNMTLKKLLPQYGIKVEEIPRKCVESCEKVISATVVRKLVQCRDLKKLTQYCPESTIQYLVRNVL